MFTISNIIEDIDRGCLANNMIEDCFSYRIIFFVNEGNKGTKHYIDAEYGGLRMENVFACRAGHTHSAWMDISSR